MKKKKNKTLCSFIAPGTEYNNHWRLSYGPMRNLVTEWVSYLATRLKQTIVNKNYEKIDFFFLLFLDKIYFDKK